MTRLAEYLARARRVLVFTGAGISTGSGIPDFRGPRGLWKKRQPVFFQDFLASEKSRVEHWDYKLEGWEAFKKARPNPAHLALVELERLGLLEVLVTQNIDGLHHAAGNSPDRIIELHGTNRQVECLSCGLRGDPEPAFAEFTRTKRCPRCSCGGWLKTATVSFGQALPSGAMERAAAAARRADLVVSIGSTLSVLPAASIPLLARQSGAPYVIINQGPTEHDDIASICLSGDAAEVLPEALEELRALR